MINVCQNCGKGIMRGNKVARARQELLYRAPKVYKPNLHTARIMQPDGTRVRMLLCTKCLRMVKQVMAVQTTKTTGTQKEEAKAEK